MKCVRVRTLAARVRVRTLAAVVLISTLICHHQVLRTFSKWAGLAGLRVGFAVTHPALCVRMMQIKQPYNINVAAENAVVKCLEVGMVYRAMLHVACVVNVHASCFYPFFPRHYDIAGTRAETVTAPYRAAQKGAHSTDGPPGRVQLAGAAAVGV